MTDIRRVLLDELDRWSFPAGDWEAKAAKEIARLPAVTVYRPPLEQLEWMKMQPRECHTNARWMAENDPEGRTKHIVGWWLQNGHFVLHSITRHRGQYVCFTPQDQTLVPERTFLFRPDPKIEKRETEDKRWTWYRDGVQIGPGVRQNPAASLAHIAMVRERLVSGMNPYEAVRLPMAD